MSPRELHITYLTAGAAGMYCGSCMHDNTLARALAQRGVDVQLVPLYTPIRTDEHDVSVDEVFFGGINVFLQQKFSLFRYLPRIFDHMLDNPRLLRWATKSASKTDATMLGALTVSVLRGAHGHQRKEVKRLTKYLQTHSPPDLVNFSNMMIAGCAPALKAQLKIPALVTLQGDDIFLDDLPEPHKSQAFTEIRRLVKEIDGFIVNSQYYADYMGEYFSIPSEKIHITPLCMDTGDFHEFAPHHGELPAPDPSRPPTVGYLARLAPEKGLHLLVDAFIKLRKKLPQARLKIAGYLGDNRKDYAEDQFARLRSAGLEDAFEYAGAVDRPGKIAFLKGIDVLSTPTVYHEPKGLFVLESLAAGVPVIQPAHGAFPELLAATGGGRLVRPADTDHLAEELHSLLLDHPLRRLLGEAGRRAVHHRYHADAMAEGMLAIYSRFLPDRAGEDEQKKG
ncbi:glycosyltransferase family 4 protein [Lignipirellula cremea]|uniref:Glycogen synthase n=1 Tax=Lignipirellula cremea TaxID=2528010 RepID=A0A518E2W4_9BACT|nr:glycosyltransferase [Lignipirellula cremea]QDU98440.1 Glycogen synthase [Lignipirellula cremea]